MSHLEVRPLAESDLPEAAALLAARHAAHRAAARPLLDQQYEDPAACLPHLVAAMSDRSSSGAAGIRDGRMTTFLVGSEKASSWGKNIWVEAAGMAAETAEDIRDVYRVAAQRWFDEGRDAHFVIVPSYDRGLVDAWFRLGFGQQHAHAIQAARCVRPGSGVHVRRVERRDVDVLAQLDRELPMHQDLSPVFSGGGTPTLSEAKQDWLDSLDDDRFVSFVAEHDGEVVGAATGCALELSSTHQSLARAGNAGFLGFAVVDPRSRGIGAGRALGETVINWSAGAGYDSIVTDWRVTNLLSSRAWPALGFDLTFLRLVRNIGESG